MGIQKQTLISLQHSYLYKHWCRHIQPNKTCYFNNVESVGVTFFFAYILIH